MKDCSTCKGTGEVLGGRPVSMNPFTGAIREELFPEECPDCEGCCVEGGPGVIAEHEEAGMDLEEGRWP